MEQKLLLLGPDEFGQVYEILEQSFPECERRTAEGQRALLKNSAYQIYTAKSGDEIQGLLTSWEFEEFWFAEHFAVRPQARGSGLGAAMMRAYLRRAGRMVILEAEPPETETARRRIGFYERLGFACNGFAYSQPSLRAGYGWLPLKLLSHPRALTPEEFERFKKLVYTRVYGMAPGAD